MISGAPWAIAALACLRRLKYFLEVDGAKTGKSKWLTSEAIQVAALAQRKPYRGPNVATVWQATVPAGLTTHTAPTKNLRRNNERTARANEQ